MSKFSHSSMSRDLPDQHRRDGPRMGFLSSNQPSSSFGRLGQGSGRLTSLLDLGPSSKMGPQGSRGMFPSGSSSQNLPSIFSLGSRGPPPISSQPSRDPDQASKILASFGLSSSDLDELSRYPEEKITAENLPQIIERLKRRRAEDLALLSYRDRVSRDTLRPARDEWDDLRPLRRETFDDRPSINPVVDYDHRSSSRKLPYRERLDMGERLRDRDSLRDDGFLSESPFRKLESDYDRLSYIQTQERSMFEKSRGLPSVRNIDDFRGLSPKEYPHLCTLCDVPSNSPKNWNEHINGRFHKKQCMLLLELYPDWNGHGMADPYMLQQSTNPAPGLLGPPPPPMGMGGGPDDRHGNFRGMGGGPDDRHENFRGMGGGPDDRHGNFRGHLGNEDMPGPRQMPRKMGNGRVVHIMEFERGKNLKFELLKLAEPFGVITNCLILNKMNEAFIEMANPEDAYAIVDYYTSTPALVYGKRVRVHMSLKYKRIKKPEGKPEHKPEPKIDPKQDVGKVVHLSNLPHSDYTDSAVLKLAETYGKVKTYILMRMRNQAFIEMERVEDAQAMIDHCAHTPLYFQGKTIKVGLSQRYKKLVLRIPNAAIEKQKEKGRKRPHSPDKKDGGKAKQIKNEKEESSDAEKSTQVVTTEDNDPNTEETDLKDLVSDSCEPELVEDTGDDEAALLETSSSIGDDAEVPDISDLDQKETSENQEETQEPHSSTSSVGGRKQSSQSFKGNMEEFVTLDEVGDEEDVEGHKMKSDVSQNGTAKMGKSSMMASASAEDHEQDAAGKEGGSNAGGECAPESENATETSNQTEPTPDEELGPYQPNNPVGVNYVIPKTGFYCKLCSLFYTSEDMAKVTHCSSLAHYQKLKKILNKNSKTPEKN